MKTRRTYFLDYPCDLEKGEKVTFMLSLHGGGSYANWQRHYFPILDLKDKYRLVIATPSSPTRVWSEADDEYLQNIVDFVVAQIGNENVKAFWLVGHSQGGMTSNRLVRTDFFKDARRRLAEPLGRPARRQSRPRAELRSGSTRDRTAGPPRRPRPRQLDRPGSASLAAAGAHCASLRPRTSRSSTRPASARWTRRASRRPRTGPTKYGCGARVRRGNRRHQGGLRLRQLAAEPAATRLGPAARGRAGAKVFVYPDCKDGRSSPTWCGSTRATPRDSSRTSRRR